LTAPAPGSDRRLSGEAHQTGGQQHSPGGPDDHQDRPARMDSSQDLAPCVLCHRPVEYAVHMKGRRPKTESCTSSDSACPRYGSVLTVDARVLRRPAALSRVSYLSQRPRLSIGGAKGIGTVRHTSDDAGRHRQRTASRRSVLRWGHLAARPARSMILIAAAYVTQITIQNPNQPWRRLIAVGTRLARHAQGLPSTGCRPVTPMCAARCSGMSCAGGRECQYVRPARYNRTHDRNMCVKRH
jgi:hypothetical protein